MGRIMWDRLPGRLTGDETNIKAIGEIILTELCPTTVETKFKVQDSSIMRDNIYFKLSDFFRVGDNGEGRQMHLPGEREILDQFHENHFLVMNNLRGGLGLPLKVTSCYRPVRGELKQGRDGSSQHCFPEHEFSDKRGACDITTWNGGSLGKLSEALLDSQYKRICWYPDLRFYHCDYKANSRQLFVNGGDGWQGKNKQDGESKLVESKLIFGALLH